MCAPELSGTHWDCECEARYIHPNVHAFCPTCGAERDEQPDAHQDEVEDFDKHWKPREEPPHETTESMMDRLAERVRILREALKKAKESLDYVSGYLDKEDSETVVESVNEAIDTVDAALEATREA